MEVTQYLSEKLFRQRLYLLLGALSLHSQKLSIFWDLAPSIHYQAPGGNIMKNNATRFNQKYNSNQNYLLGILPILSYYQDKDRD